MMIRMQGVKTSKTMFPCKRRAHLHKSASFKTIFEQIRKKEKHKNDAKNDPQIIEKEFKMYPKNDGGKT